MPTATFRHRPFLAGLLLVTASTLALEVLDTRLLSVLTWYSLAFFVIAMGLCGLTAGAVHVYLRPSAFEPERLAASLSRAAITFAAAVPVSYVLLLVMPLRVEPVATTAVLFSLFSMALALPFYPAGAIVAAAVTKSPLPIGRVYAVDLIGAALGAPLVPLALRFADAGTAILACGVLAAIAALCFARAGADAAAARRARFAVIALGALTLWNGSTSRGLVPLWVKERPEAYAPVHKELWNSHSRVQVFHEARVPAMFWGLGSRCTAPVVTQRMLVIDGHAATPLYHAPESLENVRFIECDVTNVANLLRPGGPAAIIGVGGSRDIQGALLAGHAPVVGIELNGRLLDILKGPLGRPTRVANHPAVELVHDDARSYLARNERRFRMIQASLIDTWAATGAGALALGENGLYTLEAWTLFLDRLEPDGVFTVSRWATVETARMIALASGALLNLGAARPRDHIALLHAGLVSTLIVGREPLTAEDEQTLRGIARDKGFGIQLLPSEETTAHRLRQVLEARRIADLEAIGLQDLLDFRPPTDDRPFFFNVLRIPTLWNPLPEVTAGTIEGNLLATRALGLAFVMSIVIAVATIVFPLARRGLSPAADRKTLYAGFAYFLLIGVGFMLAEIALLQRLGLLLGQPIYGLIVVLSSLVASAGLGSLVSDRLPLERSPFRYAFPIAIAGLLVAAALGWQELVPSVTSASLATRAAVSVAVTATLGLALGLAFPAGMRLVRPLHPEETPWFWGLNGVGSVIASSGAMLIALEAGLTVLTLCSAACYAALVPAIAVLARRRQRLDEDGA